VEKRVNGKGEKGNREEGKIMKRKGIKIDIKKEMQRELLNMKKIDSKSLGRRSIKEYFSSPFFHTRSNHPAYRMKTSVGCSKIRNI